MPKGDDHIQKKKSKAVRKRMRSRAGADSLEAIQGVQAAKRRRKSGTRRACEGMCYTLPTADDPFNERNDRRKRRKEMSKLRKREVPAGEILEFETYADTTNGSDVDASAGYEKQIKRRQVPESDEENIELDASQHRQKRKKVEEEEAKEDTYAGMQCWNGNLKRRSSKIEGSHGLKSGVPSLGKEREDFSGGVIDDMVLAAISEAGLLSADFSNFNFMNGESKKEMTKLGSLFGRQCREAFSEWVDVLAVSPLGWEDRALGYVVPAAAFVKVQRLKNAAVHRPLVLIIVASRDQALQVRRFCKTLKKPLGISSVCIHTGTSLETQTKGLSLQRPEILVATPERLLELLELEAISLSSVSFLVIDGLDELTDKGFKSHISKLKDYVHQCARKLIICDKFSEDAVMIARQLVVDPIARVISKPNLERRSACITQDVSIFTSVDKRLPKMLKILQQLWEKQEKSMAWSVLVLVENAEAVAKILPAIEGIGYIAVGITGPDDNRLEPTTKKLSGGRLSGLQSTSLIQLTETWDCVRDGIDRTALDGSLDKSVQVLVTTEEALGQIPLKTIQLVINYSFPSTMKVYKQILTGMARESVHGMLHSFCTASMAPLACDLVEVLRRCSQDVPHPLQMLADAATLVQNLIPSYISS